jgi:hypothetical protein
MVATCQRLGSPRPLWLYLPDGPRGNEQTPRRVDRGCPSKLCRAVDLGLWCGQGARALPRTYCCAPVLPGQLRYSLLRFSNLADHKMPRLLEYPVGFELS